MNQHQHDRIDILLTCITFLLVTIVSANAIATEVFSWTDESGIVHYSDRTPDAQNVQTIILRETSRPGATEVYPGPDDTPPDAVSDTMIKDDAEGQESGPPQSLADEKREKITRDREERREKQAEMDRMCANHRNRLASVEPRRRVFYKDESGESVRMDDDARIALVEESRDFIAKNCD